MRDPYDILGVARGASFAEIKATYRRACKSKHPHMGGSHEEWVALKTAYAYILSDLKRGYQQKREEPPKRDPTEVRAERSWEQAYRDIDDELDEMRRAANAPEDTPRATPGRAGEEGDRTTEAKLAWDDVPRFIHAIAHSGLKGLTLLFAALISVGTVLVDANVVSAIVVLGSGIGFFLSLALKNDKGGIMSAGLLLFGLMTIWLPPVRAALLLNPLATISVLVCLGLVLKFVQQGGTVGLMTGGLLALYMIGVIITDTQRQEARVAIQPPSPEGPANPATTEAPRATLPGRPSTAALPPAAPPLPPPPPKPRTLLASKGAVLKFVSGITYHLKVRTGFTTSLNATRGSVAFFSGDAQVGQCMNTLTLPMHTSASPYEEIDRTIRACGSDAILHVAESNEERYQIGAAHFRSESITRRNAWLRMQSNPNPSRRQNVPDLDWSLEHTERRNGTMRLMPIASANAEKRAYSEPMVKPKFL